MNDVTDRFIEAYKYLLSAGLIVGPKDFAEKIDVSTSMITEIIKGRSNVGVKAIQNTVKIFSISPFFLISGTGKMIYTDSEYLDVHLLQKTDDKKLSPELSPKLSPEEKYTHLNTYPDRINIQVDEKVTSETSHVHLIPFYDAIAVAGRRSGANMEAVTVPAEMINPGDWYMDATCAMRVYDESMIPEYRPGSVVALKEVYDKRLIIPGEDYVIETPEYRVIKRLQKADDKTCWLACSVNQEIWEQGPHKGKLIHEPFEIPIDLVRRIFLVLGEIRRKQCGNIFYT